jgi:histidinol-phosphate aminotransferase
MNPFLSLARPSISHLPVYLPGKPIEEVAREYSLNPDAIIKLASNENPMGSSPKAIEAIKQCASHTHMYPENSCYLLKQRLAETLGVAFEQIVVSAGSNELYYLMCSLYVQPGIEVVMAKGAFITYRIATLLAGGTPVEVPLCNDTHDLEAMFSAITDRTRLVFLPCPNNPTGTINGNDEILSFAQRLPSHVILVIDEAYVEYRENGPDFRPLINSGVKVVVTRTFSKIYGLAGLRVGYGFMPQQLAELIDRARPPFNVSIPAQQAALAALEDTDWVRMCRDINREGYRQLTDAFESLKLNYIPSEGNFVMVRVPKAMQLYDFLQRQGVIVRPVSNYGYPDHLRVTIGSKTQNARLIELLSEGLICAV